MDKSLPEHFYKYTTRSTAKIVLETRALRWSCAALLNDPYDLQFDLHLEVDEERLKRLSLDKLHNAWYGPQPYTPAPNNGSGAVIAAYRGRFPKMSRKKFDSELGPTIIEGLNNVRQNLPEKHVAFRQFAALAKILCQSEAGDILLMWSYYAEQHKGVVLRFKPQVELDSVWLLAKPVNYSEKMPRLFDEEYLSDVSAGTRSTEPAYFVDRLIFTKAAEWKHEREWRLHMGMGRNPLAPHEDLKFHAKELDGVIIGCAMPLEDRQAITELVRTHYPHAEVLQAGKHDREFRIVFEKLA